MTYVDGRGAVALTAPAVHQTFGRSGIAVTVASTHVYEPSAAVVAGCPVFQRTENSGGSSAAIAVITTPPVPARSSPSPPQASVALRSTAGCRVARAPSRRPTRRTAD